MSLVATLDIALRGDMTGLQGALDKSVGALIKFKGELQGVGDGPGPSQLGQALDNIAAQLGTAGQLTLALGRAATQLPAIFRGMKDLGGVAMPFADGFKRAFAGIKELGAKLAVDFKAMFADAHPDFKAFFGSLGITIRDMFKGLANIPSRIGADILNLRLKMGGAKSDPSAGDPAAMAIKAEAAANRARLAMEGLQGAAMAVGQVFSNMLGGAITDMTKLGLDAQRIGMTTTELAGLQHAGKMAGLSVQELNQYVTRFQRSVSEASRGQTGPLGAGKTFVEMGLDATKMAKMLPIDALKEFADALELKGAQMDKIHMADTVMGRFSDRMTLVLGKGGAGIQEMIDQVQEMGPVNQAAIAEVTAVTMEWRRFQAAVDGIARSLAVTFAPALELVSSMLGDSGKAVSGFMQENGDFIREIIKTIGQFVSTIADGIMWVVKLGGTWEWLIEKITGSKMTWATMKDSFLMALFAMQTAMENLSDIVKMALLGISGAFLGMLDGVLGGFEKLTQMAGVEFPGLVAAREDLQELNAGMGEELDKLLEKFRGRVFQKMDEFKERIRPKPDEHPEPPKAPLDAIGKPPVAANLSDTAGLQKTFEIMFNQEDYQKKAYFVANEALQNNKKAHETLKRILKKIGGRGIPKGAL